MNVIANQKTKPLLRGYIHQASFFIALCACAVLLTQAQGAKEVLAIVVYSLSLVNLLGVSALYHRRKWTSKGYSTMKRLDHSSIFLLISGTITPICLIALPEKTAQLLLIFTWLIAGVGIIQAIFWSKAPKWFRSIIYVSAGWIVIPFINELRMNLSSEVLQAIFVGGILYTLGAIIYALRRPNPIPNIFGYHEVFHLLVVIAAGFHFYAIAIIIR